MNEILEILGKYFEYWETKLAVPVGCREFEVTDMPGWVFMRITKNGVLIINNLNYNPKNDEIRSTTRSIEDFNLYKLNDLAGIEQYLSFLKMFFKTINSQKELEKVKKDFE